MISDASPLHRFEEYVGQSALAAELVAYGVAATQKGQVADAASKGAGVIQLASPFYRAEGFPLVFSMLSNVICKHHACEQSTAATDHGLL